MVESSFHRSGTAIQDLHAAALDLASELVLLTRFTWILRDEPTKLCASLDTITDALPFVSSTVIASG